MEFVTTRLTPPTTLHMASLRAQYLEEAEYQRRVLLARAYHNGAQIAELTDRLREFLGVNAYNFRLNVCRAVVSAITEKLTVESVIDNTADSTTADWIWEQWTRGRLDELQDEVYEMAVRDGEAFLLLDWAEDEQRVTFTPHPRYTSPEVTGVGAGVASASGDGFGCKAHYQEDDPNQRLLYVSKYWTEYDERQRPRSRRNDYYPDRIEKYERVADGWSLVRDEESAVPWQDASGAPLGVPAVHFRNVNDAPEAMDAWPMQDAINKTLLDLLADADVSVFRLLVAFGWYPTTDGKAPASDGTNLLKLKPGVIVGSAAKPGDASLTAIDGNSMTALIEVMDKLLVWLAMATDTPLSRFQLKRQVRSDETLDAEEEPLNVKCEKRQVRFGNSWARVFDAAGRIGEVFGDVSLPEDVHAEPVWKPIRKIDPEAKYVIGEHEQRLGLPLEFIWSNTLGYSAEQIAEMKGTDEYKARMAMLTMGLNQGAG